MTRTRYQTWAPWLQALAAGAVAAGGYIEYAGAHAGERAAIIGGVVLAVSRGAGWLFANAPRSPRRKRPLREDIAALHFEAKSIAVRMHKMANDLTVLLSELELIEDRLKRGER